MQTAQELLILSDSLLDRWLMRIGPSVLTQLIDSFLENTPERLAAARKSEQARDLEGVITQVHLILGSAGNLGAERMSNLALQAQAAAQAEDLATVDLLLSQMEADYPEVARRLRSFRKA